MFKFDEAPQAPWAPVAGPAAGAGPRTEKIYKNVY